MEKIPDSPKFTFRHIVRGILRGAAQIGEGQYRIAEGTSRIDLSQSFGIDLLPEQVSSEQDTLDSVTPDCPE